MNLTKISLVAALALALPTTASVTHAQDANPSASASTQPAAVGVKAIAAGLWNGFFIKNDGSLWGMGWNKFGQLGDGTTTERDAPVQIVPNGVTTVSTTGHFTFFIKSDGSLWGMGENETGTLGDGTTTEQHTPVLIIPGNVKAVAAGEGYSLILKNDGSLWGVGPSAFGPMGNVKQPDLSKMSNPADMQAEMQKMQEQTQAFLQTLKQGRKPGQIVPGNVTAVATNGRNSFFIKNDGSLWAMGNNNKAQLGIAQADNQATPVQIVAGGVTAVTPGSPGYSGSTIFLKSDGSLWGVGEGILQMVNIAAMNFSTPPATNDPMEMMKQMQQQEQQRLDLAAKPMQLAPGGVTAIASGEDDIYFVKSDGSLWGMGSNHFGELGDGTITRREKPEQIVAAGVVAVAASDTFCLFLKNDGSLWGFGPNDYGRLGVGPAFDTQVNTIQSFQQNDTQPRSPVQIIPGRGK